MALIRPRSCGTCSFHEKIGNQLQCHANPPSVTPILIADQTGRPTVAGHVTSWPIVTSDSWCGAWGALKTADTGDLRNIGKLGNIFNGSSQ